jgi:hypothetical protein
MASIGLAPFATICLIAAVLFAVHPATTDTTATKPIAAVRHAFVQNWFSSIATPLKNREH